MRLLTGFIYSMIYCNTLFARSLVATGTKVMSELRIIGSVALGISVIFVGYYFLMGKQESANKFSSAIIGGILIFSAAPIVTLLQSVT